MLCSSRWIKWQRNKKGGALFLFAFNGDGPEVGVNHILLLDVMMPKRDGIDVCHSENRPSFPVSTEMKPLVVLKA